MKGKSQGSHGPPWTRPARLDPTLLTSSFRTLCVYIYLCLFLCVYIYLCLFLCVYIYIYIFFFCRSFHEGYVLGNKVSGVNLNRATKWCAMWRIGSVIPCNCSWSKALSLECHIRFGSWNGNFLTNQ